MRSSLLTIALPLRLTRKAEKENNQPRHDPQNSQPLAKRRVCHPRHPAREDYQTTERNQPVPQPVRPRHAGPPIREVGGGSPVWRHILVETMTLLWRHDGPTLRRDGWSCTI